VVCGDHYPDFADSLIDKCPGCGKGKFAQYDVCYGCYKLGKGAAKPEDWSESHWAPRDGETTRFYVYILKLEGGEFYVGQSRELKERMLEYQHGRVVSTRGRTPKLVYFETSTSRTKVLEIEREWKTVAKKNPREMRRWIVDFREHLNLLDFD